MIRNGSRPTELIIENSVTILREKDILSERDVVTVAQRIYFIIQLMYIDRDNIPEYNSKYLDLVKEIAIAAPSTMDLLTQINTKVLEMDYYHALRITGSLIEYEKELTKNVSSQS